jgi:hypothetical protein
MRDKQKAQQAAAPPAHLSRDGMDAWYSQQKNREQSLKKRRKKQKAIERISFKLCSWQGEEGRCIR